MTAKNHRPPESGHSLRRQSAGRQPDLHGRRRQVKAALLVLVLAGCSASVATSNPACILMCQNSGDVSTNTAQSK